MNDGRPIFQQEDPTPEVAQDSTDKDIAQAVSDSGIPTAPRKPVDVLGNRLKFSKNYQQEPVIHGQAKLYPDSVRIVGESYRIFDACKVEDMQAYSDIRLSHLDSGRFIITSEETRQWTEAKGTWLILLRVQERMFKTFSTSSLTPDSP
jgi:hypothetical protein